MPKKTGLKVDIIRGAFVGRFQPIHNGHLLVLERILEEVDELIIIIGSAQHSFDLENPFTAGERLQMVRAAVIEHGLPENRIWIIPIPDLHLNALWVSHVQSYCPSFNKVYSNNSLVQELFKKAGFSVHGVNFIDRKSNSSTRIRQLMLENGPWQENVPPIVVEIIDSVNGVARLQRLNGEDK